MDDDALMARAFAVGELKGAKLPKVPSTGQEYEAQQCPDVVVVDIDRTKLKTYVCPEFLENATEASELAPSLEWQQCQVAEFSTLREEVARCRTSKKFEAITVPKQTNKDYWHGVCVGDTTLPLLTMLLSMSQTSLGALLESYVGWIQEGVSYCQGRWLFSIMACLNLPLTPDTCSSLRDIARHCRTLRSKTSADDVKPLNLIICLVGRYFGQMDLADQ